MSAHPRNRLTRHLCCAVCFIALAGGLLYAQSSPTREPLSATVYELAPGVYHIGSSFFYSFAVVQGDSMLVLDLPDTESRSRTILDTLRAKFPRTPVRLVVVSHHHPDHIAGLGLAFAADVPVIVPAASRDAIAAVNGPSGARLTRPVVDSMTIGSGTNAVHLYTVSNGHSQAMLVAYLPALRLLAAPDLAEWGPWEIERAALVDHVRALGLQIDRVVPGHNRVRPWSDFDPEFTRPPAIAILGRAMDALGGERALRAIAATRESVWVTRFRRGSGQWADSPAAPLQLIGVETRDFVNGRSAFAGDRHEINGRAPFRIVATDGAGYEQLFSYVVPYDADSLAVRRRELLLSPARVLLTARQGSCRMDDPPSVRVTGRPASVLRCTAADVGPFRLRVDSVTAWPLELETQVPSRVYERESVVVAFAGFRWVPGAEGNVLLPSVVETRVNGRTTAVARYGRSDLYRRTDMAVSIPDSLFAVPERVRQRTTPHVRVNELAPGVLYLESDSLYYALAVMQDSGVVLVEAAETERRMRAFLDTARGRFPQAVIRDVVATHHHPDHLAGLPLVFDRSIPVIAHADAVASVDAIAMAALGRRAGGGAHVTAVRDSLVLGAGTERELRLYAATFSEAATHVVAYLPRLRLIFAADVAEGAPGAPLSATSEVVRLINARGLSVDRVATAHSGLHPLSPPRAHNQ